MTAEKTPGTIAVFSALYPLAVLSLAPDIGNCVFFSSTFVSKLIHSRFGRTMERDVGLGLLYSILAYGAILLAVTATLAVLLWIIARAVSVARGLFTLSEKARKAAIAGSLSCMVFLVCAMGFFHSVHPATITRTHVAGHRSTDVLDLAALAYFATLALSLSRGTTRALFRSVRKREAPTPRPVSCTARRDGFSVLSDRLTTRGHDFSRHIGRRLSAARRNRPSARESFGRILKAGPAAAFRLRKGRKPAVEKLISIMGWTSLLSLCLALAAGYLLLLSFMAAGWAGAIRFCLDLLSGKGWPAPAVSNSAGILVVLLGAVYGLYHLVLFLLVLGSLKKGKGATLGTYLWGLFSSIVLIVFTHMGFAFHWT